MTTEQLEARIVAGGGRATLTTLGGQPLTATMTGDVITLTSASGNRSYVEAGGRCSGERCDPRRQRRAGAAAAVRRAAIPSFNVTPDLVRGPPGRRGAAKGSSQPLATRGPQTKSAVTGVGKAP
jgi:hypothetical protein